MAQVERNPKSITWTGSGSLATDIANLRNSIAVDQPVSASALNTLATLLNNAMAHYHTYDDAYQLATFGNNGDRNNYYVDKNSNPPALRPGNLAGVTAGNTITATDHNTMKDAAVFLRTHYHSIDDRTS